MLYRIARGSDIKELEKEVNKLISLGWKPQGGISSYGSGAYNTNSAFYQSLVME